ncbi:Glycosyltransferase involved in cell wall bisynthesis [Flexibacter flexilis DSM 6793]|uniref:Glycosyltransferase involved in cell wall bisynthesis n=1 Tax=Flexibacter flexilis DSM 6793 TaxID=927664 RepID=A0A1I1FGN9_9BACT|nr:glycosyltransferase [Flexibacter flexilis]SFB98451.1 Glycosyltransferase involved in cell wall bisynthesis [Flexibacter flexilis DSM 6793]
MNQNKPLTVLHITEPFGGGTISVINHLVNNLSQHQHIIFHGEQRPDGSVEDVKKRFPESTKFYIWKYAQREISLFNDIIALVLLLKFIRKTPHDVLHLHASKAGFLGRIVAWILGEKKVIYTSHGAAFIMQDISEFKRKMYIFLESFATKLGGISVCCSDSELHEFQKYRIPAICIYNGTNIKNNFELKNKLEITNSLNIITTGRITIPKNPMLFNKIAEHFINNNNVKFIWVGDGELREYLTSENIEITGWKSKKEVDSLLGTANLYLSTSLWEGLPLSVLEAMNLGLPLLLSNCMGNKDLVIDGQNGFSFNDSEQAIDKIKFFIQNKTSLYDMGLMSRQTCERKFDIIKICSAYNELYYQKILNE